MTTEIGSITLDRSLRKHWTWEKKPFSYGQAWIDILFEANWSDNEFMFNGQKVKTKRGEFFTSQEKLSRRWGWSRTRVRTFLDKLESDQQIDQQKDRKMTKINVCNYNKRQKLRSKGDPLNDQQKDTNNKYVFNIYNIYINTIKPAQKNINKAQAEANIETHLKKHSEEDLISAIKNYKSIALENESQYRKGPSNFFGVKKGNDFFKQYLPGVFKPAKKSDWVDETRCVVCGKRGRFARENKWYCSDKCHTGVSDSSKVNSLVIGIGKNL